MNDALDAYMNDWEDSIAFEYQQRCVYVERADWTIHVFNVD